MKLYKLKWRKVIPGDTVKLKARSYDYRNGDTVHPSKWIVAQVYGDALRWNRENFILYSPDVERYTLVSMSKTDDAKVYAESAEDLKGRSRDYSKLYDPKRDVHYERGSGYDPMPKDSPERHEGETRQEWLDRLRAAGVR